VSFSDRFELLDLLHQDGIQTFQARERATGRLVEAHIFVSSPDLLARLDGFSGQQRDSVLDHGDYEGKFYVVTAPLAGLRECLTSEPVALDSAGAWRIRPAAQPEPRAPQALPGPVPGDFTRMFQLRQAPEPAGPLVSGTPAPKPVEQPVPAAAPQPGEFTRAFQRPAAAPKAAPPDSSAPGQPGEFTRMFQQPGPSAAAAPDESVPAPLAHASQPRGVFIAIAIVLLSAIAVFIWMRRLY
jgi:hypothetical protein